MCWHFKNHSHRKLWKRIYCSSFQIKSTNTRWVICMTLLSCFFYFTFEKQVFSSRLSVIETMKQEAHWKGDSSCAHIPSLGSHRVSFNPGHWPSRQPQPVTKHLPNHIPRFVCIQPSFRSTILVPSSTATTNQWCYRGWRKRGQRIAWRYCIYIIWYIYIYIYMMSLSHFSEQGILTRV